MHLIVLSVPQPLIIRCSDGSATDINFYFMDKVIMLKQVIHKKVAMEPSKQQLYHNGRVMDDDCTIESFALPTNPILQLCELWRE